MDGAGRKQARSKSFLTRKASKKQQEDPHAQQKGAYGARSASLDMQEKEDAARPLFNPYAAPLIILLSKSCLTTLRFPVLLAYKIWTVTRRSAQYKSSNILSPVLRVIIESGAIYSMTITTALVSFVVKTNGVYVVLDLVSNESFS